MRIRGDAIKLTIFVTAGALVAGFLYLTLGRVTLGPKAEYSAVMNNVSGLEKGDLVRVAGVRVGQVDGITIGHGNQVQVKFHVNEDQSLTDRTQVLVRYENLLGDRYLELAQDPDVGNALSPGATIPADRTTPALDLDVLLNGFKPLFQGLEPEAVNALATNLIKTLQGQEGTVQSLLAQTASFTNGLADDDKAIGSLITNLDAVLGSVDSRDKQLRQTIAQFRGLVSGLAADREPIGQSVSSINRLTGTLDGLFADVNEPFTDTVNATAATTKILNRNSKQLDKILKSLPPAYQPLGRVGSHGNFFDFFLCSVQVLISNADGGVIKSPVVKSSVDRCK